jgi:hypothetical protein
MGIPDLMRFVARDATGALHRLPASSADAVFDYILVDLTNALQTWKLQTLQRLLTVQVRAKLAVVCVVDGQRSRQGTSREQRQFLQQRDADVAIHQLAAGLLSTAAPTPANEADQPQKKARTEGQPSLSATAASKPRVIVVGREVAGEGDYKLLSVHRRLQAAHAAKRAKFSVSDSPSFLFISEDSDVLCGAMCGPEPQCISLATTLHDALHEIHLLSVAAILRRLYATSGLAAEHHLSGNRPAQAQTGPLPHQMPVSLAATAGAKKIVFDDDDANDSAPSAAIARRVKLSPGQEGVQSAALDFVFLFALILGSTTTPPITKGATRVDAATCWQHYAKLTSGQARLRSGKYAEERVTLLRFGGANEGETPSSVLVDADLLSTVLEARFSDDRSRVPTAAERKYARDYIAHLVRSTVLLAVGAPIDTRGDAGMYTKPPSVSCLTSVLELHDERVYEIAFDFTLLPISTSATAAGSANTLEPVKKLPAYLTESAAKQSGGLVPGGVAIFWPPHESRPAPAVNALLKGAAGNAKVCQAVVPLPLGGVPAALNVPLAVLASRFGASIDASLHQGVKHVFMDSSAQDDKNTNTSTGGKTAAAAPRVGTANMTFDFDMRRMVPTSPALAGGDESAAAKKDAARRAVLEAAGLSVNYFDAATAEAARKVNQAAANKLKPTSAKFSASRPITAKTDAEEPEKTVEEKPAPTKVKKENPKKKTKPAATQPNDSTNNNDAAAPTSAVVVKTKNIRLGKRERARAAEKEAKAKRGAAHAAGKKRPPNDE